jgi:hypothetical protein
MAKLETTLQIRPDSATVPVRTRHAVILPDVVKAHQRLIATLAAEHPCEIVHFADKADIEERRDHLKTVMDAFVAYAEWIVSDTAENAPIGYLTTDGPGYLADAVSEIHGAFERAVDQMTDHHLEAAE